MMEEFQYTLNVTPDTVKGLDSMVITCSSAIQVPPFDRLSCTPFERLSRTPFERLERLSRTPF
jgi:hypothetical protein